MPRHSLKPPLRPRYYHISHEGRGQQWPAAEVGQPQHNQQATPCQTGILQGGDRRLGFGKPSVPLATSTKVFRLRRRSGPAGGTAEPGQSLTTAYKRTGQAVDLAVLPGLKEGFFVSHRSCSSPPAASKISSARRPDHTKQGDCIPKNRPRLSFAAPGVGKTTSARIFAAAINAPEDEKDLANVREAIFRGEDLDAKNWTVRPTVAS